MYQVAVPIQAAAAVLNPPSIYMFVNVVIAVCVSLRPNLTRCNTARCSKATTSSTLNHIIDNIYQNVNLCKYFLFRYYRGFFFIHFILLSHNNNQCMSQLSAHSSTDWLIAPFAAGWYAFALRDFTQSHCNRKCNPMLYETVWAKVELSKVKSSLKTLGGLKLDSKERTI